MLVSRYMTHQNSEEWAETLHVIVTRLKAINTERDALLAERLELIRIGMDLGWSTQTDLASRTGLSRGRIQQLLDVA